MHRFFAPLSDGDAMLLLTTLTLGGSDAVNLLAFLPGERQALLQEKASALLQIESDKRVRFMVNEMKSALKQRPTIETIHPSWIVEAMRGESPRVVGLILLALPKDNVQEILSLLPAGVRRRLPPKDELKATTPALQKLVQQLFAARFVDMPTRSVGVFLFRDLVQVTHSDLRVLFRELGLLELGQAFASVGKMALSELCRRLPRSEAEELILAVKRASSIDLPEQKSAQRFLARVAQKFRDTDELFINAGLWRFAKGALLADEHDRQSLVQHLGRAQGERFEDYVKMLTEMEDLETSTLERAQDAILQRFLQLSQRQAIDPKWQQAKLQLHHPDVEA